MKLSCGLIQADLADTRKRPVSVQVKCTGLHPTSATGQRGRRQVKRPLMPVYSAAKPGGPGRKSDEPVHVKHVAAAVATTTRDGRWLVSPERGAVSGPQELMSVPSCVPQSSQHSTRIQVLTYAGCSSLGCNWMHRAVMTLELWSTHLAMHHIPANGRSQAKQPVTAATGWFLATAWDSTNKANAIW